MRVTWEVDDGYCGKSRPHFTNVDNDELAEHKTTEERNEFIEECVQDDFDSDISFCIISTEE